MKRFILFGLFFFAPLRSQAALLITSPSLNQTTTGYALNLAVSTAGVSPIYSVEYDIDGELAGIARKAPFNFSWDTYYASNGQHTLTATARNILNTVLAVSTSTAFSVENDLPQNYQGTNCVPGSTCTDISVVTGPVASITSGNGSVWASNALAIKTTGSGTATQFAPVINSASVTSTFATASAADSAGQALVVYVAYGVTSTLNINDSEGNVYSCQTAYAPAGAVISQWCVAPNAVGSGGNVITATFGTSQASHQTTMHTIKITNAVTVSPIDITNKFTTGSGGTSPTSPLLAVSQSGDVIFFGAVWSATNVSVTGGAGYTIQQDANKQTAVEWLASPSSGWYSVFGASITMRGPLAGSNIKLTGYVDGFFFESGNSVSTTTLYTLNTGNYLNGPHQVLFRADFGNCPGCTNGVWGDAGAWEQTVTFNNPVAPIYLQASAREVMLCTTGTGNCPTSYTLTGNDMNTDGSTTTVAISSCVANPTMGTGNFPTIFTISGTCTINESQTGMDYFTATDANGFTRQVWVFVQDVNQYPHFAIDGSTLAVYTPGKSLWRASPFFSASFAGMVPLPTGVSGGVNSAKLFGPALAQAGFNTVEETFRSAGAYTSGQQAQFESDTNVDISTLTTNLSLYGNGVLNYILLIGDNWFHGTPELFKSVYGPSASWAIPGFQDANALWQASGRVVGDSGKDEVGLAWGGYPLIGTDTGGVIIGTNGFSKITGNGASCTIIWSSATFTGSNNFLITNSSNASLDYSSTTNSPLFHVPPANIVGSSLTFTCAFTGTITSGTAQMNMYVNNTFDATGAACSSTSGQLGGQYSSGPCTQWIKYDALKQMRTWETNIGSNYPKMTFPLQNGCCTTGIAAWSGGSSVGGVTMGDYWEPYWTAGTAIYLPGAASLSDIIGNEGDTLRTTLDWMNITTPMVPESAATTVDYNFQGYPVPVVSCSSGGIITTSIPHGIQNVIPEMTKLWVTGSSGGICDGNYYVMAAPTATTLFVALANPTISTVTATGGTITFVDGSTYSTSGFSFPGTNNPNGYSQFSPSASCPNTFKNHRGQTFTVSGNTNSGINSMTGWFDGGATTNSCANSSWWRQVSTNTATGGTAFIVPDLWYRRGMSWQTNSEVSAAYTAAAINEVAIEGGSGHRAYTMQPDPQAFDPTTVGINDPFSSHLNWIFNPEGFADVQSGLNPLYDFAKSQPGTIANGVPNLLHERLEKYEFQPRLSSPDYGPYMEAAARTGPYGNVLMIQSMAMNVSSCTANLSPYLVAGQPIIRYSTTWSKIKAVKVLLAGTTTDTETCEVGEFREYVFPNNEAAELLEPTIAIKLSSITNAASVKVQYSYEPLAFTSPGVNSQMQFETFDCGAGTTCTLPADQNIGPIYYRLLYLDSGGNILATSDVQKI